MERIAVPVCDSVATVSVDVALQMGLLGGEAGSGHDDGGGALGGEVLHMQDDVGADRAAHQYHWASTFSLDRIPARFGQVEESDARPCPGRASVTRQINSDTSVPR